jgi:hypothetical protein
MGFERGLRLSDFLFRLVALHASRYRGSADAHPVLPARRSPSCVRVPVRSLADGDPPFPWKFQKLSLAKKGGSENGGTRGEGGASRARDRRGKFKNQVRDHTNP